MFLIFQHFHFNVANILLRGVEETQPLIRKMLGVYFIRKITAVCIHWLLNPLLVSKMFNINSFYCKIFLKLMFYDSFYKINCDKKKNQKTYFQPQARNEIKCKITSKSTSKSLNLCPNYATFMIESGLFISHG